MQPLRAPLLWLMLGWGLVAVAILGSLLPGRQVPMLAGYDKLYHVGTYLLLMVWFSGIYRRKQYLLIAIGLSLLGLALEFAQRLVVSRWFDIYDLAANVCGVALGLVLAWTVLGGWCQFAERVLFRVAPDRS
jgi:VanZ family protein